MITQTKSQIIIEDIGIEMRVWGTDTAPAWVQKEWVKQARKARRLYLKELAIKRANRIIKKALANDPSAKRAANN